MTVMVMTTVFEVMITVAVGMTSALTRRVTERTQIANATTTTTTTTSAHTRLQTARLVHLDHHLLNFVRVQVTTLGCGRGQASGHRTESKSVNSQEWEGLRWGAVA